MQRQQPVADKHREQSASIRPALISSSAVASSSIPPEEPRTISNAPMPTAAPRSQAVARCGDSRAGGGRPTSPEPARHCSPAPVAEDTQRSGHHAHDPRSPARWPDPPVPRRLGSHRRFPRRRRPIPGYGGSAVRPPASGRLVGSNGTLSHRDIHTPRAAGTRACLWHENRASRAASQGSLQSDGPVCCPCHDQHGGIARSRGSHRAAASGCCRDLGDAAA